jgi:hypothetical protein
MSSEYLIIGVYLENTQYFLGILSKQGNIQNEFQLYGISHQIKLNPDIDHFMLNLK